MQNAFFSPLLLSEPTLNKPDGFLAEICYSRLCPSHDKVGQLLTYSLVAVIVWTTSYVMLGRVAILHQEKLDTSRNCICPDISGGLFCSRRMVCLISKYFIGSINSNTLIGSHARSPCNADSGYLTLTSHMIWIHLMGLSFQVSSMDCHSSES